jgi:alpha-tubulin suppressor-like RCC1 family protein
MNGYGQLGDGTDVGSTTPVKVVGLSGVESVAVGKIHSLAVGADGTAWAWGSNRYGQLGDGTHSQRRSAVAVNRLSEVTVLSGGWGHSVALRSNGKVWAWGWNHAGQVGDGTPKQRRLSPVRVVGLDAVTQIS